MPGQETVCVTAEALDNSRMFWIYIKRNKLSVLKYPMKLHSYFSFLLFDIKTFIQRKAFYLNEEVEKRIVFGIFNFYSTKTKYVTKNIKTAKSHGKFNILQLRLLQPLKYN